MQKALQIVRSISAEVAVREPINVAWQQETIEGSIAADLISRGLKAYVNPAFMQEGKT